MADQEAYCLKTKKRNKKCQKASAIRVVCHFLLQVLIVCSTGLAGIMLLNYQRDYTIWVLPLIIVCLFAFLVAHCFLSIYEMVVDVLFLCFAIDTKYNDGSPGREFYMDKVLMVSSPYSQSLRIWFHKIGILAMEWMHQQSSIREFLIGWLFGGFFTLPSCSCLDQGVIW